MGEKYKSILIIRCEGKLVALNLGIIDITAIKKFGGV